MLCLGCDWRGGWDGRKGFIYSLVIGFCLSLFGQFSLYLYANAEVDYLLGDLGIIVTCELYEHLHNGDKFREVDR